MMKALLAFTCLCLTCLLVGCSTAGPFVTNIYPDGQGGIIVERI